MTATVQDGKEKRMPSVKIFGNKYTMNRQNFLYFILGALIYLGCYFYFNLTAIGGMLTYFTGIPMFFTIIATLFLGVLLSKVVKDTPQNKKYVSFFWRMVTLSAIYWTIYYSEWSTVGIGMLIATFCTSIFLNSAMQIDDKKG